MILKERIRLTYPWIKIKNQIEETVFELSVAQDDEESLLFLLRLYVNNEDDMDFFTPEEREQIRTLLKIMSFDIKRHIELVETMIKEIREIGEADYEA